MQIEVGFMSKKKLVVLINVGVLFWFPVTVFGMFAQCCKEPENETFKGQEVHLLTDQVFVPRDVDNSLEAKLVSPEMEPLFSPLVFNGQGGVIDGMTPIFMDLGLRPIPLRKKRQPAWDERILATPNSSFLCSEDVGFDVIFRRALLCFERSMEYMKQPVLIGDSIVKELCAMQEYYGVLSQWEGVAVAGKNDCLAQILQKKNLLEEMVYNNYCKRLQQVKLDICECLQVMVHVQANAQISKAIFSRGKKVEDAVLFLCQCYDKIFIYDSCSLGSALNEVICDYNLLREKFMQFKDGE